MIFGATPPPSNVLAAIMLFYLIWLVLEGFWAKKNVGKGVVICGFPSKFIWESMYDTSSHPSLLDL
jgi:hypothetical protein